MRDALEAEIDPRCTAAIFAEGGKQGGPAAGDRGRGIEQVASERGAAALLLPFDQDLEIGVPSRGKQLFRDRQHAGQRTLVVLGAAADEAAPEAGQVTLAAKEGIDRPAVGLRRHHVVHVVEQDTCRAAPADARMDDRRIGGETCLDDFGAEACAEMRDKETRHLRKPRRIVRDRADRRPACEQRQRPGAQGGDIAHARRTRGFRAT